MARQARTRLTRGGSPAGAAGRFVRHVLRDEPRLVADLMAATLGGGSLAVLPLLLVELLFGRVLPARSGHSLPVIVIALAGLVIAEIVLRAARTQLAARLSAVAAARLGKALFDGLLRTPRPGHDGDTEALHAVAVAVGEAWPRLLLDGAALTFALPLMIYIDATLALAIAGTALLAGAALMLGIREVGHADAAVEATAAARDATLNETFGGIATVQALGLGPQRLASWRARANALAIARRRASHGADRVQAVATVTERVLVLGTLALGIALPTWRGVPLSVAPLLAMTLLVQRLAAPLPRLVTLTRMIAAARRALSRMDACVGAVPFVEVATSPTPGALAMEGVGFTYPGRRAPVLDGAWVMLEAGRTLGITGPSGAGKSTLARLLAGAIVPDHGTIRIDGDTVGKPDGDACRPPVLVVPGRSAFLAGTVRDVIAAGRREVGFSAIVEAAQVAGAATFIERLPRGYDTALADGAPQLSSGQRQRLALARALTIAPPVLVLDEAVSALDPEAAAHSIASLCAARRGRTTVILSHDAAILSGLDRVLTLDAGRLRDGDEAARLTGDPDAASRLALA